MYAVEEFKTIGVPAEVLMKEVEDLVDFYVSKIANHPIKELIQKKLISNELADEFAKLQYIDSVLWVPMLSIMKDRVTNPKLLESIKENILCESGYNHTSHITICKNFLESLGIAPFFGQYSHYSELATQPVELMNSATSLNQANIAGWLLIAETLVPELFKLFRPLFVHRKNVDLEYFDEHIEVDADEHAQWMYDSVKELIQVKENYRDVLDGIDLGARVALNVPDAIYSKAIRNRDLYLSRRMQ